MTPLHEWIKEVRKKFSITRDWRGNDFWEGYAAAIDDVEDFADRLEHDPTGACLLADRKHEGDHVVPMDHPILKKVKPANYGYTKHTGPW